MWDEWRDTRATYPQDMTWGGEKDRFLHDSFRTDGLAHCPWCWSLGAPDTSSIEGDQGKARIVNHEWAMNQAVYEDMMGTMACVQDFAGMMAWLRSGEGDASKPFDPGPR